MKQHGKFALAKWEALLAAKAEGGKQRTVSAEQLSEPPCLEAGGCRSRGGNWSCFLAAHPRSLPSPPPPATPGPSPGSEPREGSR